MRTLGIVAICVALIIGSGVAFCWIGYPIYTYRYRIIVDVNVEGKSVSAQRVIEVQIHTQPNLLANPTIRPTVRGEAVFIDLGNGRNLVALLASGPAGSNVDYPTRVVPATFKVSYGDSDLPKLAALKGRADLPASMMPTLVSFSDPKDPKSVHLLKPNDLGDALGQGAVLQNISIEMTSAAVSAPQIVAHLPWIGNYELETAFELTLRRAEPTGGSITPGMKLKREF